jgi:iron(III) transport system permease protein
LVRGGRSYQTVTGKAFRPRPIRLGRARPFVGAAIIGYFVVTVAAPVGMLLYGSLLSFYRPPSAAAAKAFTLATYSGVFHDATFVTALRNTAILGVGAATVVMVLTAISGYFVVRTRTPGRRLLDVLTFTPLVIPGIVLGLALAFVYLRIPLPIYGTLWILLVSYSTRYLPYGMRYSSSWWQTFRRVLLPLSSSGVMAGWIYIVIVSFRELSSTILLYSPGRETLSILIFEKFSDGNFSAVAAIGVLMVAILVLLAVLAFRVGARLGVAEDAA